MTTKRISLHLFLWLLTTLLAMSSAMAQNTSAGLTGRVTDSAGNPVPGATVDIIHMPSNTSIKVTTNADGRFVAQGLRVGGPFGVSAEKDGATGEKSEVYLQLAQQADVTIVLAPKTTTLEGVSVTATSTSQIFQADNKGVSTNVSQRELKVIPNPDRSIQQIARLDPFIILQNNNSAGGFAEISALGQNNRYNTVTIDAVPTNDSFGLEANGLPAQNQPLSYDAIEEYNISTANYDVTNKRAVGAAINIVTKSGTNDFHGSVYYAYTNADDLTGDGRNNTDFNGYQRKYTEGGTFSGPLIKDTLFFFVNYEESKQICPCGAGYGPIGSGADNTVPLTTDQLTQIVNIAKGYGLTPGDLSGAGGANQDEKRGLVKLDWNIADGHRLSVRYSEDKGEQPIIQGNFTGSSPALGLSSYWYTQDRKLRQGVINLYDDWTSNFSTEASVSYSKYESTPTVLAQQPMVNVFVNKADPATQNASVYLGEDQFRDYNVLNVDTTTAFYAGTWTWGDHQTKVGFDWQRDKFYNLFGRTEFGSYVFNSIADFQAGKFSTYTLYYPAPGYTLNDIAAQWSLNQYGLFAQDTWQLTPNFSLQYGIRYDKPQADGKPLYNDVFSTAFGVRNNGTPDQGVFEPRLSFNYTFDTESKTQLRGGIGVSESVTPGVWLSNPYSSNGLTQFTTGASSGIFNPNPLTQTPPPGTPPAPEVDVTDPNFKLPTVMKASLGFDRELPWWGLVLTVEDQFLDTINGVRYENLNYGAPTGVLPDGRASYWKNPYYTCDATGKCTNASGPATGRNGKYYDVVYLTNTDKGMANYLALQLSKPFGDDWFGSLGFVTGHATEVNPGTSSQAASNLNKNVVFNPNEDAASPSNYSFKRRVISSLTWQHHFFSDYLSSVSAFYDGHTGSPYSWVFGNDTSGICYGTTIGSSSSSNCPYSQVFIPRQGDVLFASGTSPTVIQQFYDFINGNKYLRDHAGSVAGRNGTDSGWVNQINLSLRQEIPGIFAGRGEIKLDILNFSNMLNKKWGNVYDVDFPYARTLANFAGIDPATGKYVYSLPTSGGNYAPGATKLEDQYAQSRWSLLVTVRYTF